MRQPASELIPSQGDIRADLRGLGRDVIRMMIETVMERAVNMTVGALPHERTAARLHDRRKSRGERNLRRDG